MSNYKNNHVIPRCQQKHFADKNGCIKSFDVMKQEYQLTGSNSVNMPIDKAAMKVGFWKKNGLNPKDMEDYLRSFETPFSIVSQDIIDGKSNLNDSDGKIIIDWVLSRKVFDSVTISYIKSQMVGHKNELLLGEMDSMMSKGQLSEEDILSTLDNFSTSLGSYKDAGYRSILRIMNTHDIRMVYRKPIFHVMRFDKPELITSDRSMVEIQNFYGNWDCVIPISPQVAILMTDTQIEFDIDKLTSKRNINIINRYLKTLAQHFWIHNKNYDIRQGKSEKFVQCLIRDISCKLSSGVSLRSVKDFLIDELEKYKASAEPDDVDQEYEDFLRTLRV